MDQSSETIWHVFKPVLAGLLVCALVYVLDGRGYFQGIRTVLEWAALKTSVIGETGWWLLKTPGRTLLYWYHGTQKIADLEHRLELSAVEAGSVWQLTTENNELKALLQTPLPPHFQKKVATKAVSGSRGKVVKAGSNAGVEAGMVVVDAQGVALGLIGEVGRYVSALVLFNRIEEPVAVMVAGKDIQGNLVGDGTVVRLMNVPQGLLINPGDMVMTEGSDDRFPAGLVVGNIVQVESTPAEVMQTAVVEMRGVPEGDVMIGR